MNEKQEGFCFTGDDPLPIFSDITSLHTVKPKPENKELARCRSMMNAHVMHGDIAGASIWADRAIDMALGQQK